MNPADVSPWLPYLNSTGVLGIVVLIVYAFWKRKVRTEGEVNDIVKVYEARLTEVRESRDEWKTSAIKQTETNETLSGQLDKLTDIVEVLTQVKAH